MLTAVVDADIAAVALRLGADSYITKLWDLDDPLTRIQEGLKKRGKAIQGETVCQKAGRREVTKDLVEQQVALFERLFPPLKPTDWDYVCATIQGRQGAGLRRGSVYYW